VNRVRIQALTTSMMTPAERAVGRFMRAPDHPTGGDTGGGDSSQTGDNTGGNPVTPRMVGTVEITLAKPTH
jgi:hypothetical protein